MQFVFSRITTWCASRVRFCSVYVQDCPRLYSIRVNVLIKRSTFLHHAAGFAPTRRCLRFLDSLMFQLLQTFRTRAPGQTTCQHFIAYRISLLTVAWVESSYRPGARFTKKEGCYLSRCLVNRGTMGVNSFPKTVTRQRRGCVLNPCPSALESSTLITRLPSH